MGQFTLPDLGEGLEEAQLTRWLVGVGDTVTLNQHLCEVETAKALVEIPSPWAGTVRALHAQPGDTVAVGAPLITIAQADHAGAVADAPSVEVADGEGPVLVGYGAHGPAQAFARRRRSVAAAHGPTSAAVLHETPAPIATPAPVDESAVKASPLVRKMAAERGIDLAGIVGTGPGGRIRVEDLAGARPPRMAARLRPPATTRSASAR